MDFQIFLSAKPFEQPKSVYGATRAGDTYDYFHAGSSCFFLSFCVVPVSEQKRAIHVAAVGSAGYNSIGFCGHLHSPDGLTARIIAWSGPAKNSSR
jgi:hypothetical protein